jgi:peptidoglycan/xylan/chitin deacetylase (PgdA/CDA1 family)
MDTAEGGHRDVRASAWIAALRRMRATRSLIVGHHGVGSARRSDDPLSLQVPPSRLRQQIEILRDAGFEFRTLQQLVAEAGDDGPLPPGRVVLTFDDGMQDNHDVALPILRSLEVPATFYIASGYIGKPNPWMSTRSGARMMTAPELRGLAEAGMELGGHTVTHPDLSALGYDPCADEMNRGRDQLEAATGVLATTFAYPFGIHGEAARRAARDVGFDAAVTASGFGDMADRYALPRALLWGTDRNTILVAKLLGVYEPAFHHPVVRVARKRTRRARLWMRAARDGRA